MYLEYWGFKRPPFDNIPDPNFFYRSAPHLEGLTRLIYAARMNKGCALLTGDIGSGKTTLSKVFVKRMSLEKRCDIVCITNPCRDSTEFLQDVLYRLQIVDVPNRKLDILQVLRARLTENFRKEKATFLIIDEAQRLSDAVLEEIRLLLNFQNAERFLVTIFLLGQSELLTKIRRLRPVAYRVAVSYYIKPFDLKESADYIFYRQRIAGGTRNVFSKQAIEMIYRQSNGIAGEINKLCDMSLLAGFGEKKKTVNVTLIKDVIQDGAI